MEEAAAAVGAWSQFASTPRVFRPLGAAIEDFATDSLANNFLKDAKWSPDGLCLLASADDNAIRLFEPGTAAPDAAQLQEEWDLPQHDRLRASLKVQEGETIYDMAWLPTMASSDPASCCFFSTSRDNPVHIWDAFTGRCRGSYCAYTDAEELTAGYCIAFSTHAASEQLYVGFNNCVRVFDLSRPGREHRVIPTFKRANRETTGQRGIISCIAFNPDKSGLYACGSYSRNVGLYAAPKGNLLYNLQGQRGGITQVLWSRDGNYLFVGGRKDREILCWDVRNTGTASQLERSAVHCVPCRDILLSLPRVVSTNQRLQFDLDNSGRYLVTPSHSAARAPACEESAHKILSEASADQHHATSQDYGQAQGGVLRIFDLWSPGAAVVGEVVCPGQWTSGVSIHPTLPLLAACMGARLFDVPSDVESEGEQSTGVGSKRLRPAASVDSPSQEQAVRAKGEIQNGLLLWQLQGEEEAIAQ